MSRPEEVLGLAVEVAEAAGDLLLRYQRDRVPEGGERTGAGSELAVATKSSATDPVSEADEASEQLIVERLLAARPEDGILAEEEQDNRAGTSGVRWVVDPLDGTVNFLYRIPHWCVSVAAEDEGGPLVGVVHDPSRGETFAAARDLGAHRAGRSLTVNRPEELAGTLVATGFAYDPALRAVQGRLAADLVGRVRDVRRAGAAALDLAWVAAGRLDAYVEFGLSPWDWAAGRVLVREAGGLVSERAEVLAGAPRTGLVAGAQPAHDHLEAWLDDAVVAVAGSSTGAGGRVGP